jgi:hypothetical protein
MEDVGIFYGPMVYFTATWYILWSFGIFYGCSVYFPRFGMLYQEKSGNPDFIFFETQVMTATTNVAIQWFLQTPKKPKASFQRWARQKLRA